MKKIVPLILFTLFCSSIYADTDKYAADRTELKALMTKAAELLSKRDSEKIDTIFTSDFHFTLSDQSLVKGKKAFIEATKKWFDSPEAPISSIIFSPTLDGPATFLSPTVAVANGTCVESYQMKKGEKFDLDTRWSVTLLKTSAGWRVSRLHSGVNPMDNVIVTELKDAIFKYVVVAAIVSLVIGFVLGKQLAKPQVSNG